MLGDLSSFDIIWLKSAYKNFQKLSDTDQKAVAKKIELLLSSLDILDIKKLKGHSDLYRLRIGDYRVIFTLDRQPKRICIAAVGHRREIYDLLV